MMSQFIMDIKSGNLLTNAKDLSNLLTNPFFSIEPNHNMIQNRKNPFDYSFQAPPQSDQVLDLSKRRDSTETRKSLSPSSVEGGSPSDRHSPPSVNILHHHNHITKQVFTPEHPIQYQYDYDHSPPPTNISPLHKINNLRSPHKRYEHFERSPILRKEESQSPPISPPQYYLQAKQHQPIQEHHHQHHDDSNSPIRRSDNSSSGSSSSSNKSPTSSTNPAMMVMGRDGKLSRPFKAYPRDPLSLAAAGTMMDSHSAEKYNIFRKRMLQQIHAANGGQPVINNPKMRRISGKNCILETNNNDILDSSFDTDKIMIHNSLTGKDEAYFERRKKNNAAAKKSRDRRRIKEDEIAIRAAFLERENIELKFELSAARKQLSLFGVKTITN
ncbi:unnamed protein product [Diamesa serratosioi]